MEDLLLGAPHLRPDRVEACVRRSEAMESEEKRLTVRAILAIAVDVHAAPSCNLVAEVLWRQFDLGHTALVVTPFAKAAYLLEFGDPRKESEVMAESIPLNMGRTELRFVPWSRFTAAQVQTCLAD